MVRKRRGFGFSPNKLSVKYVAASHVGIKPDDARLSHRYAIQFLVKRSLRWSDAGEVSLCWGAAVSQRRSFRLFRDP
jgi:hypothetical protein